MLANEAPSAIGAATVPNATSGVKPPAIERTRDRFRSRERGCGELQGLEQHVNRQFARRVPPRERAHAVEKSLIVALDRAAGARFARAPHMTVRAIAVVVARREHALGERSADAEPSVGLALLVASKVS